MSATLTLGEQVRHARGPIGLRELARRIGISASYLVDIEADRRRPSSAVWDEIAKIIEVDRGAVVADRVKVLRRRDPALVAAIEAEAITRYEAEADALIADPVIDAKIKAYFSEKDAATRAEAIALDRATLAELVRALFGMFHPMAAVESEPTRHDVVSRKAVLRLLEPTS